MDTKDYFHVAKLSLFNVRLLAEMEAARAERAGQVSDLVERRIAEDGLRSPVSLMHQSTFLAHAYIVLVWLREYVWKGFDEVTKTRMRESLVRRYDWRGGLSERWARDPKHRDLTKPREILEVLRNAIAHARVDIDDGAWRFSNDDPKDPQSDAYIVLTFDQLGAVCDAVFFSYNDILFPVKA